MGCPFPGGADNIALSDIGKGAYDYYGKSVFSFDLAYGVTAVLRTIYHGAYGTLDCF